jgi:Fic-DOC domain mobile mystery protein B
MGLIDLHYEPGQTPLEEEEKEGLLISSVTAKNELDEVEQRNIEEAVRWAMERRKRFTANEVLTEHFVTGLHKRMFSEVWKWAGTFRKTDKNIGVSKYAITTDLRVLLDDCRYWIANDTFSHDEIAIRLKHRVVAVHCFPNGNGRHSRLMADIMAERVFGLKVFTWGRSTLVKTSNARSDYLMAIYAADKGDYGPLMAFARS